MLSRNNKILIGCLALLLVMSVGYALFSDTITINGTATAKGDFAYEIECIPGISDELYGSDIDYASYNYLMGSSYDNAADFLAAYPESNYSNDVCEVNGNKVSFSTKFSQPGSRRFFTIKVTNTGSIPMTYNTNGMNEDESVSVNAVVTKQDGTQLVVPREDIEYTGLWQFAYTPGMAYKVKDISSNIAQTGDTAYMVVSLAFPGHLAIKDGAGTEHLTRAKAVDLSIDYGFTVSVEQITN